jgi:poly-beta-1,6-N-acetyl-D-glucosamine synthase
MIYLIVFLILCRLSFWIFGFSKLALYKPTEEGSIPQEGVSVLICVKDNIDGIKRILPKLLKQNYPVYEVILMDDFSNDNLEGYIKEIGNERLKFFRTSKDLPGKKQSMIEGVSLAKYNWILQTDSDCVLASLDWIKHMMNCRNQTTEVVLGVSPLTSSGTITSYLAAYESIYIAMQYLSYALFKKPYMGVGRNLLFNKESFIKASPYKDNMELASGDDDFIIQNISNKNNIQICTVSNGFTYSDGPKSLHKYYNQKVRHLSTSSRYRNFEKYSLAIFGFLHISVYGLMLIGIMLDFITPSQALGGLILLWSSIIIIQIPIFSKLRQPSLLSWVVLGDIFLAIFYLFLSFNMISQRKQKVWK